MPTARELPPYRPGKIQRPSLHAIAQHKPLGVTVVPVKKHQQQVERVLVLPADRHINNIPLHLSHEKAKKFGPDKTNPDSLDIFYIFP